MYFDDAVADFEDESIDILHIDGFHSYNAVKHDFETWFPKVKKGGIILLHDVNEYQDGFGANRFWDEICLQTNERHLFRHSHGLGVWRKPGGKELTSALISGLLMPDTQVSTNINMFLYLMSEKIFAKKEIYSLKKKVKDIDIINNNIHDLTIKNEEINKNIITLSNEIEQKTFYINNLKKLYDDIINSKSWKITAPLRFLAKCIRKY